jgi:glutathione synthase/RimK-type ligase-like ATP-grasp enzyme
MILLVSSLTKDDHCAPVVEALERLGADAVLLDTAEYPRNLHLSMAWDGDGGGPRVCLERAAEGGGRDLRLADCRVVWWRRPQELQLSPDIVEPAHIRFAYAEAYQALNGMWLLLDAFWVNHPTKDDEAARKPYQLKLARALGLETPATLITSDPAAARAFVAQHGPGGVIYKSFLATLDAWRETRQLRAEEVALLDDVAYAPVIFQEFVPADLDLRITFMGDNCFPSAIDTRHTDYHVDYRMRMDQGQVVSYTLPDALRARLRAYLDRLGLVYGAIDMRLTPDGRYVFLEVNPSGQWRFMEERTGVPMTDAFARLLMAHDT